MRKTATFLLLIILGGMLTAGSGLAQQTAASESRPESAGMGLYDPKTVETVSGLVVSLGPGAAKEGLPRPFYLTLDTDRGKVTVLLGPGRFVEGQPLKIAALDRIQVTGSRVMLEGKPVIIAGEVRKGGQVMRLRDEQGRPLWGRSP